MKLAEALNLRADLQRRIEQLRVRLINNAKVQDGEDPSEDPEELLAELDSCTSQLEDMITRINLTNSSVFIDGESVTGLIARKDALTIKLSVLRAFLDAASKKFERYSQNEIKILSTVSVRDKQKELDILSKQLRELDTKLQGINWTTELK